MVRLMFRLPQKSTLSDDLALLSFVYNQYCLYYFIILLSVILRMKIRTCNWATIDHSFISTTQIPAQPSVTCLCCRGKISVHIIDLLLETWKAKHKIKMSRLGYKYEIVKFREQKLTIASIPTFV